MAYVPPLHLHLVMSASAAGADAWIKGLVGWFTGSRDASDAQGAGIPLFPWRSRAPGKPPAANIDWHLAERTALVVWVDDEVVAEPSWQDWLERQAQAKPAAAAWIGVGLTAHVQNLRPALQAHQAIRLFDVPPSEQNDELRVQLSHALSRWFAPASDGRVRLFLSHAKSDAVKPSGRELASAIKKYVETRPAGAVFFDEVAIAGGDAWTVELEKALVESAVIALVTDPFSSRYWCGWEIMHAKRNLRPLVVVDALQVGEAASLAYLGKSPTIRWNASADPSLDVGIIRRVVASVLLEVLRTAHEGRRLAAVQRGLNAPNLVTMGRAPELATLPPVSPASGTPTTTVVLHPDPPLPRYELDLVAAQRPDIRLLSSTQALAGYLTNPAPLRGRCIALSISNPPSDDLVANGFDPLALQPRLWTALAVHLLASGATIAYGGDLRPGGFVAELGELARSAADANRPFPVGAIQWFVGWPTAATLSATERAALPSAFELRVESMPVELQKTEFANALPRPAFTKDLTARERFAWTLGMRDMRARMARLCDARIVVGGQLRGVSPWPGLLEEVETFRSKPVYLIGGFGGMARALVAAVQGDRPEGLTSAFQYHDATTRAARDEYAQHAARSGSTAVADLDIDSRMHALGALGVEGLANGLDAQENARLFVARDPTEIVALALTGLRRCFAHP